MTIADKPERRTETHLLLKSGNWEQKVMFAWDKHGLCEIILISKGDQSNGEDFTIEGSAVERFVALIKDVT